MGCENLAKDVDSCTQIFGATPIRYAVGLKKEFECKFLTTHGQCMCKLIPQDKDCKELTHSDNSKSTYGGTCDPNPIAGGAYSDLLKDPKTGENYDAFVKGGF